MKKKESIRNRITNEIKSSSAKRKGPFVVYIVLRIIVIAALVLSVFRRDWEGVFTCSLTLILFLIPVIIEKSFRIDLPNTLETIILFFVFCAEILGEMQSFYLRFAFWDTMLHTINGFICAAVGFALVDIFNRNKRFRFELSPIFLAIVAFCFSMTIGVLWEFFEFGMDMIFRTDMQKDMIVHTISSVALDPTNSNKAVIINGITDVTVNGESLGLGGYLDIGLIDTMKDLFVNFIGAFVFSIIGFIYVKSRGRGKFAKRFIPILEEDILAADADAEENAAGETFSGADGAKKTVNGEAGANGD